MEKFNTIANKEFLYTKLPNELQLFIDALINKKIVKKILTLAFFYGMTYM